MRIARNKPPNVLLLFSGGRDSSLAACVLAEKGFHVHLLNLDNGASIANNIAEYRVNELVNRFTNNMTSIPRKSCFGLFKQIAISSIENDFAKYRSNLICLGCKLAMHTEAIVECIIRGIKLSADGANKYQSHFPEHTSVFLNFLRSFYSLFGIDYINPVIDYENVRDVKTSLLQYNISPKSLEGSCLFADLARRVEDKAILNYSNGKTDMMRNYILKKVGRLYPAEAAGTKRGQMIYKVGAIILRNKKILVVRKLGLRDKSEYIIPGGKAKRNENPLQTLARELKEELAVDLKKASHFGTFEDIAVFEHVPIRMDTYRVTISGKLKPRSEIKEYVWIDRNYKSYSIKLGSILELYVIPTLIEKGLM